MRLLSIMLTILLPLISIGQNQHDSLLIIYKSDNLIEIVKPLSPEILKRTTPLQNNFIVAWEFFDTKNYGVLKNGEINIYDRFYQLIEHIVNRDSVRIIEENFKNGKLSYRSRQIPNDSTFINTYYDDNGNLEIQTIKTPNDETITKWHANGFLKSSCIYKANQEKCDYWDDDGIYKNGIIAKYNGYKDVVISEIETDKDGNEVRRIK